MSTTPTPYKPSPLSFNSPRTSPFRRANSPLAHSPSTLKPSTPTNSPLKPAQSSASPSQTPLRPSNASQNPPPWLNTRGTTTAPEAPTSPTRNISSSSQHTVRPSSTASLAAKFDNPAGSPTPPETHQKTERSTERPAERPAHRSTESFERPVERPAQNPLQPTERPAERERPAARPAPMVRTASSDAFSRIPPPLLHSMRESFSVLDRDNSGTVNSADVADMLSQLGLSATPSTMASYFPNGSQSINLATYLTTLSDLLSGLSHPSELSAAFEAFDDGDDGQIDMAELKDALLHTAPEPGEQKLTEREIDMVVDGFSARRAFSKSGMGLGRGEVFRYQEFIASVTGGGNEGESGAANAAPA